MRVLLNMSQAGNRSGTGRYSVELAQALRALPHPLELDTETGSEASAAQRLLAEHWNTPAKARGYDLVHYPAGVGPLRACGNLILTVHDLAALRHPEWFTRSRAAYYRFALPRGISQARRIIADSQATANDLRELLNVPDERIDVVPLGVSPSFRPTPPEALEALPKVRLLPPKFFLYVGTIEPRKNLERLIRAWQRISKEIEEDLIIAGRLGWEYDTVLSEIALANSSRIRRHFHVPDEHLPALLSAARGFVYPSLYEGFGLPPLEAMACGTPVITSNCSSIPEVTGDAALLVPPLDEEALAGAMLRLAQDDTLHAELREKGIHRAAQFTWARTAELTWQAYAKALETPAR